MKEFFISIFGFDTGKLVQPLKYSYDEFINGMK